MHTFDKYELYTDNGHLIFRTQSFRAERTSVLHKGVYTKEFSSMLAASAFSVVVYMFVNSVSASRNLTYVVTIASFAAAFLGSRTFVFRDIFLEADFNGMKKTVSIRRRGILHTDTEELPFHAIESVEIDSATFQPENIDGIDFVQKIAAQHGSAVPGLREPDEFITMKLRLTDGTDRTIYAAKVKSGVVDGEPEIPVNEIRNFLNAAKG